MDATNDDQDVLLHRSCPELIADLQRSIDPFLWRTTSSGRKQVRRNVRTKETERLVNLLEPFQELPQLLDPYLDQFVPLLANTFLASLSQRRRTTTQEGSTQLLIPLRLSICRLLYTFCKVRGEKVIARFFGTEARYIEVLLSSVEESQSEITDGVGECGWEERYITLLWLSQLLLAPFDLATISSGEGGEPEEVEGLRWPENTPSITARVVRLAIKYLASSGKERDAAKVLLVRVSLRRDMQDLGVFDALVKWALSALSQSSKMGQGSNYFQIGILSYLAGVLSASVGTTYMQSYLGIINDKVQNITADNETFKSLYSLAVARKTIIKVMRTLSVLALQEPHGFVTSEVVEGTISTLLEALGDASTPVRFAASKALSMITFKLDAEMAVQVIEAVLESLKVNVTWSSASQSALKARDLSRVNPYEWHGLILTLSHLLYRRSPPLTSLSDILAALEMGLSFEQKSTTGASIGTNVRDAACFGIWALARRYTTSELNTITLGSHGQGHSSSTLQHLANLLVVSACLDPAGNIRRGSSAALQELIGRHPDTVEEGIAVVQVVDYHAVALRSRAIQEVSFKVARLAGKYHEVLLQQLLGWRGVMDTTAVTRENAAKTFGKLTSLRYVEWDALAWDGLEKVVQMLCMRLSSLAIRDIDARHGLTLCLVHVLINTLASGVEVDTDWLMRVTSSVEVIIATTVEQFTKFRSPEIVASATSQLISASLPFLRRLNPSDSSRQSIATSKTAIDVFMAINNDECIEDITRAATELLQSLLFEEQEGWCNKWVVLAASTGTSPNNLGRAYISCVFRGMSELSVTSELGDKFHAMVSKRWYCGLHVIHTKTAILSSLAKIDTATRYRSDFLDLVTQGLDDYTTDARGDVGSFVRIEALKVVAALFTNSYEETGVKCVDLHTILSKVLRLAAEKLDKVRAVAQMTLGKMIRESATSGAFTALSISSIEYFSYLLNASSTHSTTAVFHPQVSTSTNNNATNLLQSLLAGYVTSADTGSEDLVLASRLALARFCTLNTTNGSAVFAALSLVVKVSEGEDRIIIPALEVLGFLSDADCCTGVGIDEMRLLFLRTQKAQFKTTNVKKLDAAIKIYGALIEGLSSSTADGNGCELRVKVMDKLTSMLSHPFPRVRERVIEELWCRCAVGKGIDVSVKAIGKEGVEPIRNSAMVAIAPQSYHEKWHAVKTQ